VLKELKQFMFYDRPPQLNIPVEHRATTTCRNVVAEKHATPPPPPPRPSPMPRPSPIPRPLLKAKEKATNNGVFTPHQKDTLFWCFYKIMHDELLENINIAVEKTLKIQYVEEMRKHKELIKKYKFAPMTHIENQLANEEVIDIAVFFVLSLIHKLNVVYVKNKTYYEMIVNEAVSQIYIVYFLDDSNKYGYSTTTDKTIYNTFYKIDNLHKPIKAISSYKVSELIEICNKLSISVDTLKNKKHYYEAIIKKID